MYTGMNVYMGITYTCETDRGVPASGFGAGTLETPSPHPKGLGIGAHPFSPPAPAAPPNPPRDPDHCR